MKKIFVLFILALSFLCVSFTDVNASASEASIRGFNVTDFTYVDDEANDYLDMYGSSHYYGKINLWTAVYKFYNAEEDKMFYAVLMEATINASTFKNASRSFSAKRIDFNVVFDNPYARLVSYSPQPQAGSYTITTSFGYTLTYASGVGYYISPSISYSLTQEFDEISQYVDENNSSVLLRFNFTRYADNERGVPYQGAYRQKAVAYFAIDDYSINSSSMSNSEIVIDYDGSIFKDGAWFESNYTLTSRINDTYKYTSNGNFN